MSVKKGLGRGLSSLIPTYGLDEDFNDNESEVVERNEQVAQPTHKVTMYANGVCDIPLEKIKANPNQPRKSFSIESLNDLAESIKNHGVLQPIVVTERDGMYMIVAGERRFRACQIAERETIPAIIKDFTDAQVKELALIENIQREDLNPIEIARGYKELMDDFNWTQEKLAKRLGKQRSSIANYLRLLSLEPEVVVLVQSGELSLGHAKVLVSVLKKDFQIRLAKLCVREGWSVRKLEQQIKANLTEDGAKKFKPMVVAELKELVSNMQRVFGTKVSCIGNDNKGRIFIDYYTRDDLDRIYEILETYKRVSDDIIK